MSKMRVNVTVKEECPRIIKMHPDDHIALVGNLDYVFRDDVSISGSSFFKASIRRSPSCCHGGIGKILLKTFEIVHDKLFVDID